MGQKRYVYASEGRFKCYTRNDEISWDEVGRVQEKFERTSSTRAFTLQFTHLEKVHNEALLQRFARKKQEYKMKHGHVRVVEVFHGTKTENIASILQNNLLVEYHGQNIGHRFGAGVSFSALAHYASYYCDAPRGQMLLFYVLVSNIVEVPEVKKGPVLTKPPYIDELYPLRYDTTAKDKHSMNVIVKFENHTFYPAYIIHFKKTENSCFSRASESMSLRREQRPRLDFQEGGLGRTYTYRLNRTHLNFIDSLLVTIEIYCGTFVADVVAILGTLLSVVVAILGILLAVLLLLGLILTFFVLCIHLLTIVSNIK